MTEHRKRLSECEVTVVIFEQFSSRSEAMNFEKHMILIFKPECNIVYTDKIKRPPTPKQVVKRAAIERERRNTIIRTRRPIYCITTNKFYYGSANAGRVLGIHQARISAAVTGKTKGVEGLFFRYATWQESDLDLSAMGKPDEQDRLTRIDHPTHSPVSSPNDAGDVSERI